MGWKRRLADLALSPAVLLGALPLKFVRSMGIADFPLSKAALLKVGVFPIRNHFYEPLFDFSGLPRDRQPRNLPGLDFNLDAQLRLLQQFEVDDALAGLPFDPPDDLTYALNNSQFGGGDAELWYHVIRHFKPKKIIEVGSGHSTLLARLAIEQNRGLDPNYRCEHICIEPFRMPWLDRLDVQVIRLKLENVDLAIFSRLSENDILFIDSSHIIRPGGDVLLELLEIIPTLATGTIVHVHDIFSPRDYPDQWLRDDVIFWNEQYLIEAFLTNNSDWEVLLSANLLKHEAFELLKSKCPHLTEQREPGSLYIQRL